LQDINYFDVFFLAIPILIIKYDWQMHRLEIWFCVGQEHAALHG